MSLERIYKTEAVVLRRVPFSESDYLLTLYTPQHGKVKALAKGARKPTSRQTGHVELYSRTHLVLYRGRELHTITQAEVQDTYRIVQENLERSVYASHFVELMDQFAFENEENQPAYLLLVEALGWLCEPTVDLKLAARYYELRLLRVMGFEPSLFDCAIGSEPLEAQNQYFSPVEGGVVCPEHGEGRDLLRLSLPVLKILRHMSRYKWNVVKLLNINERNHVELERTLHTYIIFLLEKRLQSVNFLKKLYQDT